MKRTTIVAAFTAILLSLGLTPPRASASVSLSLHVGDPYPGPPLAFVGRPNIVMVPGTRVYYVDDYDLYRYGPYWYYNYDGGWYRARDYDGSFTFISYTSVPGPVRVVPVQYRHHWRSYRGPAYTYYSGGRWYREKPAKQKASYTYARSTGHKSGAPVYRPADTRGSSGKGHGKEKKNGRGQAHSKGNESGHGHGHGH